jgi:hypothetical protein
MGIDLKKIMGYAIKNGFSGYNLQIYWKYYFGYLFGFT